MEFLPTQLRMLSSVNWDIPHNLWGDMPAAGQLVYRTLLLTPQTSDASNPQDDYMLAYANMADSGFAVFIKEQDDSTSNGTFRDCRFDFACLSRGRVFCHGAL